MKTCAAFPDSLVLRLARDLLAEGRSVVLTTQGQSMRPLLREGDSVEIVGVDGGALEKGDIVAVQPEEDQPYAFVVHRFIRRDEQGRLILRGDANRHFDRPLAREQMIGKVVGRKRDGRWRSLETPGLGLLGRHIGLFHPLLRLNVHGRGLLLRVYRGGPPLPVGSPKQQRNDRMMVEMCLGRNAGVHGETLEEDVYGDSRYAPLLPLLSLRRKTGEIELPDSQKSLLEEAENLALVRSARTEALLKDVAGVLEKSEQSMLLTKGAALAFGGVYPEPHTRLGSDVDFLCDPEQKEAVVAALLAAGYRNAEPEYPLKYYYRYRGEVALYKPDSGWPVIEIHWTGAGRIYHHRRLGYGDYLPHSHGGPFGSALRVLEPEYELLLIFQHLGKHLRHLRPLWLLDAALLSESADFDWRKLARAVHRARLHWTAWYFIHWAEARRPGTFPEDFIRTLARRRSRAPRNWIEQRLSHSTHEAAVRWIDALGLPTWPQRLGYWSEHVWPSRYVMERMYPQARGRIIAPFHLRRWLRLLTSRLPLLFGAKRSHTD